MPLIIGRRSLALGSVPLTILQREKSGYGSLKMFESVISDILDCSGSRFESGGLCTYMFLLISIGRMKGNFNILFFSEY